MFTQIVTRRKNTPTRQEPVETLSFGNATYEINPFYALGNLFQPASPAQAVIVVSGRAVAGFNPGTADKELSWIG